MSYEFYNVAEDPFKNSADIRFLHLSSFHSRVLNSLTQNARSGHVQALVAPFGSGKTMLLYALLERLRDKADTAFVVDVSGGGIALLGSLLNDLGLPDPGPKLQSRREVLNRFLLAHRNTTKPVVAVLDNAHNLDSSSVEEIDASLEHAPRSFQIVLAGQMQLATLLSALAPPRLLKRITHSYDLVPLSFKEIRMYVRHRLKTAGYSGDELFTDKAIEMLAHESLGVPRIINNLCSRALDYGSKFRKKQIDESVISQILALGASMNGDSPRLAGTRATTDMAPVRSEPMFAEPPAEQDHNSRLAQLLRGWLWAHSGLWSGTTAELYEQLQSGYAADLQQLTILSPVELRQRINLATPALMEAGVSSEILARPGQPRILSFRLTASMVANSLPRSTAA